MRNPPKKRHKPTTKHKQALRKLERSATPHHVIYTSAKLRAAAVTIAEPDEFYNTLRSQFVGFQLFIPSRESGWITLNKVEVCKVICFCDLHVRDELTGDCRGSYTQGVG